MQYLVADEFQALHNRQMSNRCGFISLPGKASNYLIMQFRIERESDPQVVIFGSLYLQI